MPGAESPSESRVRLTLVDAGLAPDHLQYEVYTDGGFFVARLDIAFTRGGKKVGMEVDSGEHDRPKALYRDRDKLNALRSLGWDVRQVTQHDAFRRPGYVVQQVEQALSMQ
jgi:very-short-patch-repair endonuclease